jgi:hypothetical protein
VPKIIVIRTTLLSRRPRWLPAYQPVDTLAWLRRKPPEDLPGDEPPRSRPWNGCYPNPPPANVDTLAWFRRKPVDWPSAEDPAQRRPWLAIYQPPDALAWLRRR